MKLNVANSESMTQKSWADVVQNVRGDNATKVRSCAVRPAKKGECQVLCRGKLLVMLGYYGWIEPLEQIDHPAFSRHAGRIYVSKKDIQRGATLTPGEDVIFYLYADEEGIGAEDVRPANSAGFEPTLAESKIVPKKAGLSIGQFRSRFESHRHTSCQSPQNVTAAVCAGSSAAEPPHVILVRPELVEGWMHNVAPPHTSNVQQSTSLANAMRADAPEFVPKFGQEITKDAAVARAWASEASTSAGESSDSDVSGLKVPKVHPWRKMNAPSVTPPGLDGIHSLKHGAVLPPPGLELPHA